MTPAAPFETLEEIREYRAGTNIECLVCGKRFLRLTYMHLSVHNLTADEYREQFGIPWTYSLTSATSRFNTSRMQKDVNKVNLTYRRKVGDSVENNRKAPAAARNYWKDTIRPQGPLSSAQERIVVPCMDCGEEVATTRLTHVHGTRCVACRKLAKAARDVAKAELPLPRCA